MIEKLNALITNGEIRKQVLPGTIKTYEVNVNCGENDGDCYHDWSMIFNEEEWKNQKFLVAFIHSFRSKMNHMDEHVSDNMYDILDEEEYILSNNSDNNSDDNSDDICYSIESVDVIFTNETGERFNILLNVFDEKDFEEIQEAIEGIFNFSRK